MLYVYSWGTFVVKVHVWIGAVNVLYLAFTIFGKKKKKNKLAWVIIIIFLNVRIRIHIWKAFSDVI